MWLVLSVPNEAKQRRGEIKKERWWKKKFRFPIVSFGQDDVGNSLTFWYGIREHDREMV